MAKITPKQIQIVHTLGSRTGTKEQGNREDALHSIVFRVAGKTSIKELTQKEFKDVVDELNKYLPKVDMMTEKQIKFAWGCVYKLRDLDTSDNKATAGKRMIGTIKKVLDVDVDNPKYMFQGLTKAQGEKLIENLKRYVSSAEAKAKK